MKDSRAAATDDRGPRKAYGKSRGQSYQDKPWGGNREKSYRPRDGYGESDRPAKPLGKPIPRAERAPQKSAVDQAVDMFGDAISGEKRRFGKPVREAYDSSERSVRREAEDRRLKKQSEKSARNGNFPSQEDLEGGVRPPRKNKYPTGSKYIPSKDDDVGEQPPRRVKTPWSGKQNNP
jgi:hypothetical protein